MIRAVPLRMDFTWYILEIYVGRSVSDVTPAAVYDVANRPGISTIFNQLTV